MSAPSVEQQSQDRQQAQDGPAVAGGGHGGVAQVGIAALVGVVKVKAAGVFLSTNPTLRRHCTALLIHRHCQGASSAHGFTEQAALAGGTLLGELEAVQRGDGREQTGVTAQGSS